MVAEDAGDPGHGTGAAGADEVAELDVVAGVHLEVVRDGPTYCSTWDVGSPLIFAPATDGIVASSASWAGVTVLPVRAANR